MVVGSLSHTCSARLSYAACHCIQLSVTACNRQIESCTDRIVVIRNEIAVGEEEEHIAVGSCAVGSCADRSRCGCRSILRFVVFEGEAYISVCLAKL